MKQNLLTAVAVMMTAAALSRGADRARGQAKAAEDRRPFGKYLVAVCELGRGCYDPTEACKNSSCLHSGVVPKEVDPKKCTLCDVTKKVQAITLKQVGCAGSVISCSDKPEYPLRAGHVFYLNATSKSGLPITLEVKGNASQQGGMSNGTQRFLVTGEGPITVTATQEGNTAFLAAPPAKIVLQTADSSNADCYGLYKEPVITTDQPDITQIAALAGNPTPFLLAPQDNGTILVYATRWPFAGNESAIYKQILATLNGPLGSDPAKAFGIKAPAAKQTPFQQELRIAHAAALGDPAARITALGYKFTVQNVGSPAGKIRVTAADTPGCSDWKMFLTGVRELEWSLVSEPSVTKLWHLNADDASKAMSNLFPAAAAGGSGSGSGSPPGSGSGGGGGSGSAAVASPNASVTVSQPPGSKIEIKTDTTPCVEAGLAFGNSNACAPANPSAASSGNSPAAAPASPIPAPKTIVTASLGLPTATPQAGQLPQSPNDMLIYGNPLPGDDAQIEERNRILAQLDLPHPEMIINAWVMQNSAADPRVMGDFSREVRMLVERYNEALEKMVLTAYGVVSRQMLQPGFQRCVLSLRVRPVCGGRGRRLADRQRVSES